MDWAEMVVQFSNEVIGLPSILTIVINKREMAEKMTVESGFIAVN
jgi:hypothetical protein